MNNQEIFHSQWFLSLFYSLVQPHKWSSVTQQNIKLHRRTISQALLWTKPSPLPVYRFDWLMEHGKSTYLFSPTLCSKCCQQWAWNIPPTNRGHDSVHLFPAIFRCCRDSFTCWVDAGRPNYYLPAFAAVLCCACHLTAFTCFHHFAWRLVEAVVASSCFPAILRCRGRRPSQAPTFSILQTRRGEKSFLVPENTCSKYSQSI